MKLCRQPPNRSGANTLKAIRRARLARHRPKGDMDDPLPTIHPPAAEGEIWSPVFSIKRLAGQTLGGPLLFIIRPKGEKIHYLLKMYLDPQQKRLPRKELNYFLRNYTLVGKFKKAAVIAMLLLACTSWGQSNTVTITVPAGSTIITPTSAAPAVSIMPHATSPTPEQLHAAGLAQRFARLHAEKLAAPWVQTFIVVRVGKDGTNSMVTLQAVPDSETNAPVAWGAAKSGLLNMGMTYPAKVGDLIDFWPRRIPQD